MHWTMAWHQLVVFRALPVAFRIDGEYRTTNTVVDGDRDFTGRIGGSSGRTISIRAQAQSAQLNAVR